MRADAADVARAFRRLRGSGAEPRGVMFWVIDEEGANGDPPAFFARDLAAAFRDRGDL